MLNRWLLELTSILSADGNVDPDNINVLPEAVQANTAAIQSLSNQVAALNTRVTSIEVSLYSLDARMSAAESAIVQLQNLPRVYSGAGAPSGGIGRDGDWYAQTTFPFGVNVKVGGAWVLVS